MTNFIYIFNTLYTLYRISEFEFVLSASSYAPYVHIADHERSLNIMFTKKTNV